MILQFGRSRLRSGVSIVLAALLSVLFCSCYIGHEVDRSEPGRDRLDVENGEAPDRLAIPRGHLPPSESCRIWLPNTPPGRQPAPGDCDELRQLVPLGAWLVQRPGEHPNSVRVSVYSQIWPLTVIAIYRYDISTGRLEWVAKL